MVDDLQKDRQIAYTTVMTVMDNLYRKGWRAGTGTAEPWRYEPTGSRSGYTAALMSDALATSADRGQDDERACRRGREVTKRPRRSWRGNRSIAAPSACGGAIARRPFVIFVSTIATLKDDRHEH